LSTQFQKSPSSTCIVTERDYCYEEGEKCLVRKNVAENDEKVYDLETMHKKRERRSHGDIEL